MPNFFSPADVISALRQIYHQLQLLHPLTPYSKARLARLADQTTYCLEHWPLALWPQYSRQGEPIPAYSRVREWVQHATQLLASLPSSLGETTTATWQQAAYILRRTVRLLT